MMSAVKRSDVCCCLCAPRLTLINVRGKVSRAQRTPGMRSSPNYNFLRTGRSPHEPGFTDLTPENVEFLRHKYVRDVIHNSPLKDAGSLLQPRQYSPELRRCGAVGVKLGSYPLFRKSGEKSLTTLIQLIDTQVIDVQPTDRAFRRNPAIPRWVPYPQLDKKYFKVTVGCKNISPEWVSYSQMRVYAKNGVPCKEKLTSFIVPEESVLPIGTPIYAGHFVPGQLVNVIGRSVDRGFQGGMKRWNFAGLPASHGVSLSHRAIGATGNTGAARVFPGRKMPGQMGDKVVFKPNVRVMRINTKYNVVYLENLVPGLDGAFISLSDSHSSAAAQQQKKAGISQLPYPTYCPTFHQQLEEDVYAPHIHDFRDPSIAFDPPDLD